MPHLVLIAAALLLTPITLSMASAPRHGVDEDAVDAPAQVVAAGDTLTEPEARALLAAALLVALEWGRR